MFIGVGYRTNTFMWAQLIRNSIPGTGNPGLKRGIMSTRASIYYERNDKDNTDVHIYEEMLDDTTYLEVSIADIASMRIVCPPALLDYLKRNNSQAPKGIPCQ